MKIHLTSQDFSRMATSLCSQIVPIRDQFEWIVGIERGGIPISTWLSYALGKKHASVKISLYGDDDKKKNIVPYVWFDYHWIEVVKSSFLLVDDIVDSGETLNLFRDISVLNKARYWVAALHWCKENSPYNKPDFYVETKKKEDWIVYPWEKETA
jgi:hypoxanthine phosphoribosyltransferase